MDTMDVVPGDVAVKMDVDCTTLVNDKLPEYLALAESGNLTDALENMLGLEKQTRLAADMVSTSRVMVAILRLCYGNKEWEMLNEYIILLTKRRSQLKQAVQKMVQEAITYIDETPNMTVKLALIDTLRAVTDGKIYVEIERARLTRTLATIKEAEGKVTEAAEILQELQVETFGSMEKREKVEFLLEQMRLCLAKKDNIRSQIISKKISSRFFDDSSTEDLKLKFYQLMIEIDQHENSYLEISKHFHAIYDTKCVSEDKLMLAATLKNIILYLILAPHDNEQSDLLNRMYIDKNIEQIGTYRKLLKCFITPELMRWRNIRELYETELRTGSATNPPTEVFESSQDGQKRWADFKIRVVEHNIRTLAKYYTQIKIGRMAELLEQTEAETEEFLSELVVKKTVYARIDRLAGVIQFSPHQDPGDVLNKWSNNLNQLMGLLSKTTHLINKEEMIHKFNSAPPPNPTAG